ncbi:MAG: hypothetical protein AAF573_16770 [Bacteroidota bacterium]
MAFVIKYHILFEVRILHGYHLKNEIAFYGKTQEQKAEELLANNFNIASDLKIEPTEACEKILKNHRLKFKITPWGFIVGVETRTNATGEVFPFLPIDIGTTFHFKMKLKNSNWTNVSNVKLKPTTRANFYFSNFEQLDDLQTTDDKSFGPTLSLPHLNFNEERPYEMGEVILDGTDLKIAIQNADGTNPPTDSNFWTDLDNVKNVSETDRRLLPSKFSYQIIPNNGITVNDIEFSLLRPDNTEQASFSKNNLNGKTAVTVDFRKFEDDKLSNVPSGEYTLLVISDDLNTTRKVHVEDEIYDAQDWGVIAIAHQQELGTYRILEDDGKLRVEDNTVQHPIFEIRVKSRATYWQYILHTADNITIDPANTDFSEAQKIVTSKKSFPLSRFPSESLPELEGHKLPTPSNLMIKMSADKTKYVTETYLPILESS